MKRLGSFLGRRQAQLGLLTAALVHLAVAHGWVDWSADERGAVDLVIVAFLSFAYGRTQERLGVHELAAAEVEAKALRVRRR